VWLGKTISRTATTLSKSATEPAAKAGNVLCVVKKQWNIVGRTFASHFWLMKTGTVWVSSLCSSLFDIGNPTLPCEVSFTVARFFLPASATA